MKKGVLLLILMGLGFTNVNAQKFKFGAKAGVNISTIKGDNEDAYGNVTSVNIGFQGELPISEKFSFQPEMLFSGQGFIVREKPLYLTYLNFPLIGKYYVTQGFSLEAGPQLGVLLIAKRTSVSNVDTNITDYFSPLDFGVNLGVGYRLKNGINFSARYNIGFSNINDFEGATNENTNNVFQFSIGYFFL